MGQECEHRRLFRHHFLPPVLLLPIATSERPRKVEFATIRWDGRDNTYLIRPNDKVDKFKQVFEKAPPRPDGIEGRTYYMTIAMNAAAKEGFDFAGLTQEQFVMKRTMAR